MSITPHIAEGPGLVSAEINKNAEFTITGPKGDICIAVYVNGTVVHKGYRSITDIAYATFIYRPKVTGTYTINVTFVTDIGHSLQGHQPIQGSPFTVPVTDNTETVAVPETAAETDDTTEEPEAVVLDIPVSKISKLLIGFKDMPIGMFSGLVQRLLSNGETLDLWLIIQNLTDTPDCLARLSVLLSGGIKMFKETGFVPINSSYHVMSYSWPVSAQKLLVEYILGLSGEDLYCARTAFRKNKDLIPVVHKQAELFIHLGMIPKDFHDYKVIIDCATEGVYQTSTAAVVQFYQGKRDIALQDLEDVRAQRDFVIKDLEDVQHQRDIALQELAESKKWFTKLRDQRDDFESKNFELKKSRETLTNELEQTRQQVSTLTTERDDALKTNAELHDKCDAFRGRIWSADQRTSDWNKKCDILELKIRDLSAMWSESWDSLKKRNDRLVLDVSALTCERDEVLDSAKKQISQYKASVVTLTSDLKDARDKLSAIVKAISP